MGNGFEKDTNKTEGAKLLLSYRFRDFVSFSLKKALLEKFPAVGGVLSRGKGTWISRNK